VSLWKDRNTPLDRWNVLFRLWMFNLSCMESSTVILYLAARVLSKSYI